MISAQRSRLISRGQAGLEALCPATLVIAGLEFAATGGALQASSVELNGLYTDVLTRSFRLRRDLLAATPVELTPEKTTLTEGDESYRLQRLTADPADPCLHLLCVQI